MARTEVTGRQIKNQSVSLADDVVDVLPVANGGTGNSTVPAGSVLVGNDTGAVTAVAPGTAGYVLTSNGSTWVSAASIGQVTLNGAETLYNKTISGASNTLTDVPISALSTTGSAGSATYLRGDGTWATVVPDIPAGIVVDEVVVVGDSFQFYSQGEPVGEPISLLVAEIDGGSPFATDIAFYDGGTV